VLIYGAVTVSATRVCEITSNGSLEETLATLASELSVVFAGALVATDNALDARLFAVVDGWWRGGVGTAGVLSSSRGMTARGVIVVGLA